jgi:hypothetical protein
MQMLTRGAAKLTAGVLIGICLLTGTLQANVSITPAFVEVNLAEGRPSGVFYVSNLGEKEERYRINAIHVNYTEDGALTPTQTGQFSLAPWIRFNPRELTIAPGTQRAVRFAILVPRQKLTDGEWWGVMELESLAVGEIVMKTDTGGHTLQIQAVTKIVVPIFGTVGKPTYQGRVEDLQVQVENGEIFLKALVAATGTGRIGIKGSDYEIVDASGKVVDSGLFAAGYVFRGGRRWFSVKIEAAIPKGQYTARVNLPAPHLEQPMVKEAQVSWPEVPPPGALAAAKPAAQPATEKQQGQGQPGSPTDGNKQTEVQGSTGSK